MTPLRAKMISHMQLQRLAPSTQDVYLRAVAGLATYYRRSPAHLTSEEIRGYLHHLLVERQLAWSTCNVRSCPCSVRVIPSPETQVKSPHFTTM